MKIDFHHVNICSTNVPEMAQFYDEILGLTPAQTFEESRVMGQGYDHGVAFFKGSGIQFHLANRDLNVGHLTKHSVNPVERGHIAFRTDDIEAFKKLLDEKGVKYSDYGEWAMEGWYQIYFFDPEGNVIEVHQYNGEE